MKYQRLKVSNPYAQGDRETYTITVPQFESIDELREELKDEEILSIVNQTAALKFQAHARSALRDNEHPQISVWTHEARGIATLLFPQMHPFPLEVKMKRPNFDFTPEQLEILRKAGVTFTEEGEE